jgi:hypothetical protein
MTRSKSIVKLSDVKCLLEEDRDLLKELVKQVLQESLEAEMEQAIGAGKGERTDSRLGYRSGYYTRTLITRVGKLELRIPQDRSGVSAKITPPAGGGPLMVDRSAHDSGSVVALSLHRKALSSSTPCRFDRRTKRLIPLLKQKKCASSHLEYPQFPNRIMHMVLSWEFQSEDEHIPQ